MKKTLKVVTHRRSPLQCRRYSQAIAALRSLQFRYLPQCVVRVWDLTSLAVVLSLMVVDNDYQRNFNDLKTTRDGLARHGNVKEMRVAVSKENLNRITTNCFAVTKFQHAENLPTNATDNFGRLRLLPDSSPTNDDNTRWLAASSKLQFAA